MRTDVVGKTFGNWTIQQRLPNRMCVAQCGCGLVGAKRYDHIVSGKSASCGCQRPDRVSTAKVRHGGCKRSARAPEFNVWCKMIQRCENQNSLDFQYYGGRGIKVCAEWHDYARFISDMGPRPSPSHQIDRKDNDGDYTPDNCSWATRKEQCRNRRTSRFVTALGQTKTVAEWSEFTGVKYGTLLRRLDAGWSSEEAIRAN